MALRLKRWLSFSGLVALAHRNGGSFQAILSIAAAIMTIQHPAPNNYTSEATYDNDEVLVVIRGMKAAKDWDGEIE